VISEAVTGEKISVDAPFFNRVNIPIGLFLLFLTGVGPLIAWRRSSLESLKRAFLWPTVGMFALMAVLFAFGIRHMYALLSFGLCLFVGWSIASEFWKGARAISAKAGSNLLASMVELTHRNTRRYGGYIVHMAIVFMFIGFTGAAFNKDETLEVPRGGTMEIGRYTLRVTDIKEGENDNYIWQHAVIQVSKGGEHLYEMRPERRVYKASRQGSAEVAIRRHINEDLYINFASMTEDGQQAVIQAYVFPLVSWIWIGFWVLLIGTWICLVPSKVRLQYARTQVVGMAEKHANTVQK
jgi:cytochrome c-type biogenesis protein CcmF